MTAFKINPESIMVADGKCELHGEKGMTHRIVVSKETIEVCNNFYNDWVLLKKKLKQLNAMKEGK